MKTGRKPILSIAQKEYIWEHHQTGTKELSEIFDVSRATIRRVKKEKGLQATKYIGGDKEVLERKKEQEEQKKIRFDRRLLKQKPQPKSDKERMGGRYMELFNFAKSQGHQSVMTAIDAYGSRTRFIHAFNASKN
jgi:hypothetical protein